MISEMRWALETVGMILSLVLIVYSLHLARRLAKMDEAALSVRMFLDARRIRYFLVTFSVALLLFVAMPLSILAYLWTDDDSLEVVHDASHLVFLLAVLAGYWGLARLYRRAP